MTLAFGLLALIALATALAGGALVVRGLFETRALDRRLARPVPVADAHMPEVQAPAEVPDGSRLTRLLEARAPWLGRCLASAGAPFTAEQVALGAIVISAVMFLVLALAGLPPLFALVLGVWCGGIGPMLPVWWLSQRRRQRFRAQMPQAIDLIARSLQAGHPVSTAMSVAASQMPDPTGPEFARVLSEISYGGDRDAALRGMAQRFPLAEVRMFAASLEVTREAGGNVAEVLLRLGETMRAKDQLRRKVEALSAEGRLSFWVISALPVLVITGLLLLNPAYYGDVINDPLFWPLMSGPPILLALGAMVIWRLIDIKV